MDFPSRGVHLKKEMFGNIARFESHPASGGRAAKSEEMLPAWRSTRR